MTEQNLDIFYFKILNGLLLFWLCIKLILKEEVRLKAAPSLQFIYKSMYQYFTFHSRSIEVNESFLLMFLTATTCTKILSYS